MSPLHHQHQWEPATPAGCFGCRCGAFGWRARTGEVRIYGQGVVRSAPAGQGEMVAAGVAAGRNALVHGRLGER